MSTSPPACPACRWFTGTGLGFSLSNRCGHRVLREWSGRSSVPPLADTARGDARPCGPAGLLFEPKEITP